MLVVGGTYFLIEIHRVPRRILHRHQPPSLNTTHFNLRLTNQSLLIPLLLPARPRARGKRFLPWRAFPDRRDLIHYCIDVTRAPSLVDCKGLSLLL